MKISQYVRQTQYKKDFIAPILIALIALILTGGAYVYFQTKDIDSNAHNPASATSTAQTSNPQTADWKTYTNTNKDYAISYPTDAKIDTSNLSCVRIDTKEFGSVAIGNNSDACGMVGGVGIGTTIVSETVTINGQQYKASGVKTADNSQSLADFSFTNKIYVRYGVNHLDKSNPNSWKNLGPLTDAEYQKALSSAKEVVSTLKSTTRTFTSAEKTAATQGEDWKGWVSSVGGSDNGNVIFAFLHPSDEKVEWLATTSTVKESAGQKIVSVQVDSAYGGIPSTCVEGVDVKCTNIQTTSTYSQNVTMQTMLDGTIIGRADFRGLTGMHKVLFYLSCDELITRGSSYCQISDQRVIMFKKMLSTFALQP